MSRPSTRQGRETRRRAKEVYSKPRPRRAHRMGFVPSTIHFQRADHGCNGSLQVLGHCVRGQSIAALCVDVVPVAPL
jgi:hypothetical protein